MIFTLSLVRRWEGWMWHFDIDDIRVHGALCSIDCFKTQGEALSDARKWARKNGVRYRMESK